MKRIFLFLAMLVSISAMSQTIKFSGFTSRTTITGSEYIVGYNGPTNIRIPVGKIAENKIDSSTISQGPSQDTIWFYKGGIKKFYQLVRASTTGGTTAAPTAPTPAVGDNSTRVATAASLIAERSAAAALSGKTLNGANNTFLNIPQSAVVNVAADIAARVTFQQLRDSLNRVDTTRKFVFVNMGTGYGLIDAANADSVKVLSLIGDNTTATVTRVGNNLVISAIGGGVSLSGNNNWTGINSFDYFYVNAGASRHWGMNTQGAGQENYFEFGDDQHYLYTPTGAPNILRWYHGGRMQSMPFAAGPTLTLENGEPSQAVFVIKGAVGQSANLWNWTTSTGTVLGGIAPNGEINIPSRPFADNAAAIAAGLPVNRVYRTADGTLKVVY